MCPHHPSRRPTGSLRVVATVALLVLVSACGGGIDQKRTKPTDLEPSPVKKVDKDKAAIVTTLAAYRRVTKASLSPDRKLPPMVRIRAVVAEPYATRYGRQLATERSSGLVMRGADIYTTRSVRVSGLRATLVACWDGTKADVVNIRTTPAQKARTTRPNVTTFSMSRAGDAWKITKRTPGRPC